MNKARAILKKTPSRKRNGDLKIICHGSEIELESTGGTI